jgi:O-antigen/teichoic acid export membrane protein
MHHKTIVIVRGAGVYFVSTVISSIGTFLVSLIIALHFGKEGLGILSVVLTVVLIGVVVSELGLNPYIIRMFSPGERAADLPFAAIIILRGAAALVAAVFLSAGAMLIAPQVASAGLVAGTAILIVSRSLGSGFENLIKARRRHLTVFAVTLSFTVLQISIAYAGSVVDSVLGDLILLLALADVLKSGVLAFMCRAEIAGSQAGHRFSRDRMRSLMVECIPFMAIGILSLLTERADVLLLAHLRDAATAGVFSAADRFLVLVSFIDASVLASTLPVLRSATSGSERRTITGQLLLTGIIVSVVISAGLCWGAPLAIRSTFRFHESVSLLRLLAIAIPPMVVSRTLRTVLYAAHWERMVAWILGGSCCLSIALNVMFIPTFGAVAAALITVGLEYGVALGFAIVYFRLQRS